MEIFNPSYLFNSLLYSFVGVFVFWLCFMVIDKLTPYNLWREIVEEKNMSLAIVVASMCLGIAVIVASAIHG